MIYIYFLFFKERDYALNTHHSLAFHKNRITNLGEKIVMEEEVTISVTGKIFQKFLFTATRLKKKMPYRPSMRVFT